MNRLTAREAAANADASAAAAAYSAKLDAEAEHAEASTRLTEARAQLVRDFGPDEDDGFRPVVIFAADGTIVVIRRNDEDLGRCEVETAWRRDR